MECENALKEIEHSKGKVYKIVGGIMIDSKAEDIKKDLTSKVEVLNLRIKAIEEQEKIISDKAKRIQEEVVEKLNKK